MPQIFNKLICSILFMLHIENPLLSHSYVLFLPEIPATFATSFRTSG